jgi:ABC-2 type transport system ATP-binding protein
VLPEVQKVCDRVAMLREGKLVTIGSVSDIRRAQRRRLRATFTAAVDASAFARYGEIIRQTPTDVEMLVAQTDLPVLVTRLGMLPLTDLTVEPPSLEDAFMEHYR